MVNIKQSEPLLDNKNIRLTTLPIKDMEIWGMYKKQMASFWTPEEIDLSKDPKDWEKLDDDEKHFIKHVLAFFASSDAIVNMNLLERFTQEVTMLEAQYVYTFQAMMENVHSEVYSLLIDTYIKDVHEKDKIFNAIKTIPCIKKKADWALKWITSDDSFAKRLIAFAIVEGIFFSGSFCAIYWFKQRNLLEGLCLSNDFISRDEKMHTEFACMLYHRLNNKLSQEEVHNIVKNAVDIEKEFITKSLPCDLIGMNSKLMSQYIEHVADLLVSALGYDEIFGSLNPFPFMEALKLEGITNFFEKRVSEYSKAGVITNMVLDDDAFESTDF
jgi:ribonucleoside-diphosphate reductase beta chain